MTSGEQRRVALDGLVEELAAMSWRTHLGGDLRAGDEGTRVTLAGWVARRRDHGGLVFVDLRDQAGLVQLVFNPDEQAAAHAVAHTPAGRVRRPGRGRRRAPARPRRSTRAWTRAASRCTSSGWRCSRPRPCCRSSSTTTASTRRCGLRHRYLDLRRDDMRRNIHVRFKLTQTIRRYLEERGFWELETPILYKSTPEGAREFLVPTSSHPGSFYALPQSPQTYKQLYVISGFERYYQIARCFRDEATRADRTAEFTQLDMELAFVQPEELFELIEGMFAAVWRDLLGRRAADAVPAHDPRRGDAALRLRQAGHRASGARSPTSPTPCAAPSSRRSGG